ncbi:MAG: glutaminyl-peptide cyclotransferase [Ferruginibacter sp.]
MNKIISRLSASIILFSLLLTMVSCNNGDDGGNKPIDNDLMNKATKILSYNIIQQYPHDTSAFTEGLQLHNGKLYEGTGMEGESTLRITDMKTGKVEKRYFYTDPKIFGEGIQVFKGRIYQLTWRNHIVYVFDEKDISKPVKTFNWPNEGWGMTNNGTDLIISDGSPNLYFVQPDSFRVRTILNVTDNNNNPVADINELEYVDGFIYANIWQTDSIVKIDPQSGKVVARLTLPKFPETYFPTQINERTEYLNGIAYDSSSKTFLITGKRWPIMFQMQIN